MLTTVDCVNYKCHLVSYIIITNNNFIIYYKSSSVVLEHDLGKIYLK